MKLISEISFGEFTSYERIGVAYSGGLDSTVLLHLLSQSITDKSTIFALHVNHSVSPSSNKWEEFCSKTASDLGIQFTSWRLGNIDNKSEENLRNLRYKKFIEWGNVNDLILTAHHQEDQIETILFRIMRGTGINGLEGIPVWRKEKNLNMYRPLLDIPKDQIKEYALSNELTWIEDESNKDITISRNFLRQELIPKAKTRWNSLNKSILHLSAEAIKQNKISLEIAVSDLNSVRSGLNSLDLKKLLSLSKERVENLLFFWLNSEFNIKMRNQFLKQVVNTLRNSKSVDTLKFPVAGKEEKRPFVLYVKGEEIFISEELSLDRLDANFKLDWDLKSKIEIPSGLLFTESSLGHGISSSYIKNKVIIRGREGGERCKPYGRDKSQKLKKLLQEYQIPPWQRDRLPLIYIGDKLAAVSSLWVCEEFHAKPNEKGILINWNDNNIVS